jgi:hypothetical protein
MLTAMDRLTRRTFFGLTAMFVCGCRPGPRSMRQLIFLAEKGCESAPVMRSHLDAALRVLDWPTDYQVIDVATLRNDDPRSAYPTPTLLYANRDVFGLPAPSRPPGKQT